MDKLSVWVVEGRNPPGEGEWSISEIFLSERVAFATCLDNVARTETPYWKPDYRVREYLPAEETK